MDTRNTIKLHGAIYEVDTATVDEILDAINCPDGASSRGYDRIDFKPLHFFDAISQMLKSSQAGAYFTLDLLGAFNTLDEGQAVAVGLPKESNDWYFFNCDLERADLKAFRDFYIFERPENVNNPDTWLAHANGDSTVYRLTLTNL